MGHLVMPDRAIGQRKAKSWASNAVRLKLSRVRRSKPANIQKGKINDKVKFKQGWRDVDGRRIYFRSAWEANYGRYLQWQKEREEIVEWYHEPQTFWFEGIRRGCVSYLPDFQVIHTDASTEWIEVKGFMDPKSRTKISRFRKYYPKEKLRVVDAKWYKKNSKNLSSIIPEWEKG